MSDGDVEQWINGDMVMVQVRMIQAVLPHMRAAKRGHIINVTSLVGITAFPFTDAYSASKFAVRLPFPAMPVRTAASFMYM